MATPVFHEAVHALVRAVSHQLYTSFGEEGTWKTTKVHARIRNGQPTVDIVVIQDEEEIVVVPDYNHSCEIVRPVVTMWSQQGAEDWQGIPLGSAVDLEITNTPGSNLNVILLMGPVKDPNEEEEEDSKFHDAVYEDRKKLYSQKFLQGRPMSYEIGYKIVHLSGGNWPGGELVVFQATGGVLEDCHVTTSFGLTNPDMPAQISSTFSGTRDDHTIVLSKKEEPPLPRVGMAGYGYEFLILTRESADWPKAVLSEACTTELLGDYDFLRRVEAFGGHTMGPFRLDTADNTVQVLISEARNIPTGATGQLLNGKMKFLVITVITDEEVQYGLDHEYSELLDLLYEKADGQVSHLDRKSVV